MPESLSKPELPDFFKWLDELRSWQHQDDPLYPVHSALCRAFHRNNTQLLTLFRPVMYLANTGDVKRAWSAAEGAMVAGIPLLVEGHELQGWLFQETTPTEQGLNELAEMLRQRGYKPKAILDALKHAERRVPKRPIDVKKRWSWMLAFELMLQGKSYGAAIRELNRRGIGVESEEALRAGIRQLKDLLRRYAPELVIQFEKLHPNRAVKSIRS